MRAGSGVEMNGERAMEESPVKVLSPLSPGGVGTGSVLPLI